MIRPASTGRPRCSTRHSLQVDRSTLYALATPLGVPLSSLLAGRAGPQVSGDGLTVTLLSTDQLPARWWSRCSGCPSPSALIGVQPQDTRATRQHLLVTTGRPEITTPGPAVEG